MKSTSCTNSNRKSDFRAPAICWQNHTWWKTHRFTNHQPERGKWNNRLSTKHRPNSPNSRRFVFSQNHFDPENQFKPKRTRLHLLASLWYNERQHNAMKMLLIRFGSLCVPGWEESNYRKTSNQPVFRFTKREIKRANFLGRRKT